jgi:transposase InsO family protein
MKLRLHANARTTPKTRAYIQSSQAPERKLAAELGISVGTVRSWRGRTSVEDRSHTPHRLRTTLNAAQEAVVIELRRTLLLPLDDLLVVTREFIHAKASRSGLNRCLRRHGVGDLHALMPQDPTEPITKTFKDYEPGFVHVDIKYLPQMPDEKARRYLFVAIDRATRWVFLHLYADQSLQSSVDFLHRLVRAAPMKVVKLLTDNGTPFTDRFTAKNKTPSGRHAFDKACAKHGIEHRLIQPRHPQTNGMVERFNGRIADILKTTRLRSGEDLRHTLQRYAVLYNEHLPQRALGHLTPQQALRHWRTSKPDLFVRHIRNHAEPDT